jgi:ComF family protein
MPISLRPIASVARIALALVGEIVAPSRCAACDARVAANALFCASCAISVVRLDVTLGVRRCRAVFEYGGSIAEAVQRLKFGDRPDLACRLAAAMGTFLPRLDEDVDIVVPVPLHPKRLAERGYNQATLLARPIARTFGRPLVPRALRRIRDTRAQALLDRRDRLFNMRRAFLARAPLVAGAHVLLVDDVQTTGATLAACTEALRSGGARAVSALVLARRTSASAD